MNPRGRRVLIATLFMMAVTWFPFPVAASEPGIDNNPVEVRVAA